MPTPASSSLDAILARTGLSDGSFAVPASARLVPELRQ